MTQIAYKVAELPHKCDGSLKSKLVGMSLPLVEKLLHFPELNEIYMRAISSPDTGKDFCQRLIEALNVNYRVTEQELDRIPKTGGAIAVANHPFGGIEAAVFVALLRSVRKDVKILANHFLSRVPELHEVCIFVDPFGTKDSIARNIRPVAEAVRWARNGGMLAIFPAGEVSHLKLNGTGITDPEWSAALGRIVKMTKSPVVPVFFSGNNGMFFQFSGLIHRRIRTALLPREFINKKNKTIDVSIGRPIEFRKLEEFQTDIEISHYLRHRTYILEHKRANSDSNRIEAVPQQTSIVEPHPKELIMSDVSALPSKQRLVTTGDCSVFYAYARQIPYLLHEIGRCREVTFRQAGEGTGKEIDLDGFDKHYVHLVVWNDKESEVVGAYRLGHTDYLVDRFGMEGLYTSSLFKFKPAFLNSMRKSLELGRSFVMPKYQKSFSPLMLLWKGIGHYVLQNPEYKMLFGPVSIDNKYHRFSQLLIVSYLEEYNFIDELAGFVKPRTPFKSPIKKVRSGRPLATLLRDVDDLSNLISDFEDEKRGIPVLLRQYLKLGGKLLGFNVDEKFSNVLDGLILVDLTQTDEKILSRYMGDRYREFLDFHKAKI